MQLCDSISGGRHYPFNEDTVEQHTKTSRVKKFDLSIFQVDRYRTSCSNIGYRDKGLYTSCSTISSLITQKTALCGPLLVKKYHQIKRSPENHNWLKYHSDNNNIQLSTTRLKHGNQFLFVWTKITETLHSRNKIHTLNFVQNLACFS